ncbi:MAG: hypothetical protein MRZ79_05455 [Bacteroidia bacterium]|nr:hypothetical protein [Bacteroidia bacterium]
MAAPEFKIIVSYKTINDTHKEFWVDKVLFNGESYEISGENFIGSGVFEWPITVLTKEQGKDDSTAVESNSIPLIPDGAKFKIR